MKFKARALMKSCPDFTLNTELSPLPFETAVRGTFDGQIGSISLKIGEIPVRMAIPFLKPRNKLPVIASIGGFRVKLQPFNIKIQDAAIHLKGTLGEKAIKSKMEGKINCSTEMEMDGKLLGKSGAIKIEFDEDADGHESA